MGSYIKIFCCNENVKHMLRVDMDKLSSINFDILYLKIYTSWIKIYAL